MPNKSFGIYSIKQDNAAGLQSQLVFEMARTHIACVAIDQTKAISAFELFSFTDDETADYAKLFRAVSLESTLLNGSYSATTVFINNEFCLPVPVFKFNTEIAPDYLNIVFGEDTFSAIHFDHLAIEPGIMNIYRIQNNLSDILQQTFPKITFRHTWSNIIKTIHPDISNYTYGCIYVRFYNTFIILILIKEEKLQLVQTFVYETPEDVLYYLLNISKQFELNSETLILKISGMIDLNFTLYRELITYFRHVEEQNADTSKLLMDIKEYPLHYFTPFFNLAL